MTDPTSAEESLAEPSKVRDALQEAADKILSAGRGAQNATMDLAASSTEAVKEHASELIDAAKGLAADAGDRLQDKVAAQKGASADYFGNLAQVMRRAAGEFDTDVPVAGRYIRKAALQVENAADAIRKGNLNDLVDSAQSFARNQPTAFLGLAVLAGFVGVRFLKSSSSMSPARDG
jgi:hypothetical protein